MAGELVLVVDDNPTNLKLIRIVLESDGFVVRGAADAEEALRVLGGVLPSLILMDIQLPGMDGIELTRHLKVDPRAKGIPVVAVTSYAMKGDEQRALAAGCDAYISKPIDTRGLGARLRAILTARAGA